MVAPARRGCEYWRRCGNGPAPERRALHRLLQRHALPVDRTGRRPLLERLGHTRRVPARADLLRPDALQHRLSGRGAAAGAALRARLRRLRRGRLAVGVVRRHGARAVPSPRRADADATLAERVAALGAARLRALRVPCRPARRRRRRRVRSRIASPTTRPATGCAALAARRPAAAAAARACAGSTSSSCPTPRNAAASAARSPSRTPTSPRRCSTTSSRCIARRGRRGLHRGRQLVPACTSAAGSRGSRRRHARTLHLAEILAATEATRPVTSFRGPRARRASRRAAAPQPRPRRRRAIREKRARVVAELPDWEALAAAGAAVEGRRPRATSTSYLLELEAARHGSAAASSTGRATPPRRTGSSATSSPRPEPTRS